MKRLLFWVVLGIAMGAMAAEAPWAIHLSWQHDPTTTMTIMWRTDPEITESVVEYGPTPEYGEVVTGATYTYTYAGKEIRWHTVELVGLSPGTTYHYRCGAPGYWSADHTFTTAPEDSPRLTYKFAVLGDSRGGYKVLGELLGLIAQEDVDFIIFTGDLTDGGSQYEYDRWFAAAEPVISEIPLISVHGNHEAMLPTYFEEFAFPGNEKWFSFDYGPVHFVFLLSISETYVVQQRPWLLADLRQSRSPWTIVVAHKPAYSADENHGPTRYVLDHWVDIFERFGVDLYFNGHAHDYERTWPIRGGRIDQEGVIYVTTGGAGAPLHRSGRDWWTAVSASVHHYIVVQVRAHQLRVVVKDLQGEPIDRFLLTKP